MSSIAQVDPVRKGTHSRHNSTASPTVGDHARSIKQQAPLPPTVSSRPIHYTCLIRLPFSRDGFEDPAPVQWDTIKDRALWKLISQASNSKELDWEEMSIRFGVSLNFLLQQAAWLYERHFEGMKAQMKRMGAAPVGAGATSPMAQGDGTVDSTVAAGGVSMQRVGSRESRAPISSIVTNRDITTLPSNRDSGSSPGTPRIAAPPLSRTPSSATVTQSRIQHPGHSRTQPLQRALRGSSGSERKPNAPSTRGVNDPYGEDAIEHEGPFASDSEEESSALARSRALRRAPIARKIKPSVGTVVSDGDAEGEGEDDDDDDDSGGYLPFAATSSRISRGEPPTTARGSPRKQTGVTSAYANMSAFKSKSKDAAPPAKATTAAESSTSSASSAMQPQLSSSGTEGVEIVPRPGPISPRHRAQLASLSPRMRREGSEGSPSMGSSFSDLDDASVTQSALEDALLSNMRQGNFSSMASRMSSLRDALGR